MLVLSCGTRAPLPEALPGPARARRGAASAGHIIVPTPSTPTNIDVEELDEDGSFRVVFAPRGFAVAKLKFDDAESLAELLVHHARRAELGAQDKIPLIARTRGIVGAANGRVVVRVNDHGVATYAPEDARLHAAKIQAYARLCEIAHWNVIDGFHTGGVKVHRFLGLPVCTTYQQYERLGDRSC